MIQNSVHALTIFDTKSGQVLNKEDDTGGVGLWRKLRFFPSDYRLMIIWTGGYSVWELTDCNKELFEECSRNSFSDNQVVLEGF